MMQKIVWGLDIGGTKCAVCAADQQGRLLGRYQIQTASGPHWEALLEELIRWALEHLPEPTAVGVSCGGPLDSRRGLILSPPNLPGWDNVPITAWLSKRLNAPAFLQNDANACALAEWQFGAGRGCSNLIFLTFGTGFGAGLVLGGKLYEGACDMAGEVGHIRMTNDGPVGYGKAGSLEGYCSGGGLLQLAQLRIGCALTARELAELADSGDEAAIAVLQESAQMLGRGAAILIDLLNPERIVIGSIFQRAERWFRAEMERVIAQEALTSSVGICRIVPAQLGDRIGDIAAVTVAFNGLKEAGK